MTTIFISNEWSADSLVAELIRLLKSLPDIHVDQSPLNPMLGEDSRWSDWYRRGCVEAIANADCFVAVVTKGYDSSSWMAHEFDVAWKQYRRSGRPLLFVANATAQLPGGFKNYEDDSTILPTASDAAVAALLAHVRLAGSTSDR